MRHGLAVQSIYRFVGLASLLANGTALTVRDRAGAPAPVAAAAVADARGGGSAKAERGDDGLFHLAGRRGTRAIDFVVDTGATVTVLTAADADRLGAEPLAGDDETMLATAGGRTAMTWRRLPSLDIGGRHIAAIDVAVVEDGIGRSLLGQDVLAQLGTITIAGDRLEIGARG